MEKYNKLLVILIVVIVLIMSIGYSALNSELSISGEVNYRPQEDVRITNFTTGNKPSEMTITYSDFSKHQVKLGYTTTKATSITYTVEVTNYSNVNMGILKINGLDSNIKVQENIIGTKLVGSGEVKTFTITFNSTNNSTKAETETYLLTFEFAKVYTVTYNGFKNTENFKNEVLEGDTFTQNFGSDAPEKLEVTMNGTIIDNYTYTEGNLLITNVTGNLIIKYVIVCSFPNYTDSSGANAPVLNGDMIPVVYSEECKAWVKQDLNKSYDYNNQIWANAVTVTSTTRSNYKKSSVGTVIPMEDINTMWVWIPRYSYTIKSEDGGTNYFGKNSTSSYLPGEIDAKFIPTTTTEKGIPQYTGDTPSGWRTNDAFNFGESTKAGIWVGKFETTGSLGSDKQTCINTNCDASNVTIKPGLVSINNQNISSYFYMARSMQLKNNDTFGFNKNSGDLHLIKNDEWGAVAYLSQSKYGKYGNKSVSTKRVDRTYETTGTFYKLVWLEGDDEYEYLYIPYNEEKKDFWGDNHKGIEASTTGTVYGIYDMSGGNLEFVMAFMEYDPQGTTTHNGQLVTTDSGFIGLNENGKTTGTLAMPDKKYYNIFKLKDPTSGDIDNINTACNGEICYGQAISETYDWNEESSNTFVSYKYNILKRNTNGNYDYVNGDYYHNVFEFRTGTTPTASCHLTLIP